MKKLDNFNVRAYALCENHGKLLVVYEYFDGKIFCKLPGGGVEFGEGILECLHREFMEELNIEIDITEHFYTQEQFVESIVDDGKQLLFIYYIVKIKDPQNMIVNTVDINRFEWVDINEDPFWLPIDKIVLEKYREKFKTKMIN